MIATDSIAPVLFVAALIFCAYWVPTFIAWRREHHQFKSILVINLFAGWTFIGWVVALAMAVSATPGRQRESAS